MVTISSTICISEITIFQISLFPYAPQFYIKPLRSHNTPQNMDSYGCHDHRTCFPPFPVLAGKYHWMLAGSNGAPLTQGETGRGKIIHEICWFSGSDVITWPFFDIAVIFWLGGWQALNTFGHCAGNEARSVIITRQTILSPPTYYLYLIKTQPLPFI